MIRFQLLKSRIISGQDEVMSMECRGSLLPSGSGILTEAVYGCFSVRPDKRKGLTPVATTTSFYILFISILTNHPVISLSIPIVYTFTLPNKLIHCTNNSRFMKCVLSGCKYERLKMNATQCS